MQIIERVVAMMQRYTEQPDRWNDEVLKDLAYFIDNYGAGYGYDNVEKLCSSDLYLHNKLDKYEIYQLQNAVYDIPMTKLAKQILNIGE